jgi:hypothetical protein
VRRTVPVDDHDGLVAEQLFVPAMGFTSLDQRQPGFSSSSPTAPPPTFRIFARPFGNSRTSSGFENDLCSLFAGT